MRLQALPAIDVICAMQLDGSELEPCLLGARDDIDFGAVQANLSAALSIWNAEDGGFLWRHFRQDVDQPSRIIDGAGRSSA